MHKYLIDGQCCASAEPLPFLLANNQQPTVWLYRREPALSRSEFPVRYPGQLDGNDSVCWLNTSKIEAAEQPIPQQVASAVENGTLRAVNLAWPDWRARLLPRKSRSGKLRLHLLAMGDVGSTIAIGLKLLGGDVLDTIGICDIAPAQVARWEFELNQVTAPWDYDTLPEVQPVDAAQLFDCDVFVFAASKGVPPVGVSGDVRMAQLEANRGLVSAYAKQAREVGFQGLICVVSDPVDPLCKAAFLASNAGADGCFDCRGLRPEQIQGFGLGVMNARAAYYAKKQPELSKFLREGRAYGPHGAGLVIADSVEHYDDKASQTLTRLALAANLEMRSLGFKPYVAPALSSAAISILLTLRGQWHYGSVLLGGVYFGCKNRWTACGLETEALPLPERLQTRLVDAAEALRQIL